MIKIRKGTEKRNTNHFASHDTYFPFQQETSDKNIFYNARQLHFYAAVQNQVQSQERSVFIYHNTILRIP